MTTARIANTCGFNGSVSVAPSLSVVRQSSPTRAAQSDFRYISAAPLTSTAEMNAEM
jgi:hypothetical protein